MSRPRYGLKSEVTADQTVWAVWVLGEDDEPTGEAAFSTEERTEAVAWIAAQSGILVEDGEWK